MQSLIINSAHVLFASDYGAGSYDTTVYNGANGSVTSSAGGLVNTGTVVVLFITLACVIIFIALFIRLWRKPKQEINPTSDPHAPVQKQ